MKKVFSYFFQGLVYLVPTVVTVYIIFKIFLFLDGLVYDLLPVHYPGLGILIIFLFTSFVGIIGPFLLARPIVAFLEGFIEKAPLIKIIYFSVKDLLNAFVDNKKRFSKPVLVKLYGETDIYKIGFITQHDLHDIGVGNEMVAVYFPHSYAFSGNLFIVPIKNITPIDMSAAEVMKFIVSGGVTKI